MHKNVILVGGEKGGTSKTTLATNLAVVRARAGRDVVIVDTDPQGSASRWKERRDEADASPVVHVTQFFGKAVRSGIADVARRYQDVIVDAGGKDSEELGIAMTQARMILIPIQASQADLETLDHMAILVANARTVNEHLRALVVVSRAPTNPSMTDTDEAHDYISEIEELDLAISVIRERAVYRRAFRDGTGITEYLPRDERGILELSQLYKEVYGND